MACIIGHQLEDLEQAEAAKYQENGGGKNQTRKQV